MAYNPDEIAKVKHLNEFARQLRIKLDGGTDPKPARSISQLRFWKGSNNVYATANNGVFTVNMKRSVWGSTAAAPTVWLNSDSFAKFDCVPYLTGNVTEDVYQCQPGLKRWTISFYPNQADASTIDVTFHFPENDTYAALDVPLTITITED